MRLIPFSARRTVGAVVVMLSVVLAGQVEAQGVNHLYDKFQFGASAADVVLGTTIRIDNSDGTIGTDLDLGNLGISKSAFAPAVGFTWRPGKRHELGFNYLWISRTGDKVLTDTIYFADTSFAAGLRVKSKFSAPNLAFNYRFAFMAKENTQLGFQVGLGLLFFGIDIDALAGATGGGADTTEVSYSASKNLTGPTASLGLYGQFRFGEHWILGVNGGAIGASVSNISATSWTAGANGRYFFNDHWGAAAGWAINGVKVSSEGDGEGWIDLNGSIKYTFQVFSIGVIYALP